MHANKINNFKKAFNLSFLHFSQTSNGRSNSSTSRRSIRVSSTSSLLITRSTFPDTSSLSSDRSFTTMLTVSSGFWGGFQFSNYSSNGWTVSATVFTSDPYLLCSFSPVTVSIFIFIWVLWFMIRDWESDGDDCGRCVVFVI